MRNIRAWVAGAAQHHAEAVAAVQIASQGHPMAATLTPEDHNAVDPHAVRVHVECGTILQWVGYVPAKLALDVRQLLANGAIRSVTVTPTRKGGLSLAIQYVAPGKRRSAELLAHYATCLAGAPDGVVLQGVGEAIYRERAELRAEDKATLRALYQRAVARLATHKEDKR